MGPEHKKTLRTFLIEGGPNLVIEIAHTPPLVHQGTRTLWPVYCTQEEASKLLDALLTVGVSVSILHQEPGTLPVTHSARTTGCTKCFFFDPGSSESCGLRSRHVSEIAAALSKHEKAREDRMSCTDPPELT